MLCQKLECIPHFDVSRRQFELLHSSQLTLHVLRKGAAESGQASLLPS
jgi:hypothetical protein